MSSTHRLAMWQYYSWILRMRGTDKQREANRLAYLAPRIPEWQRKDAASAL